MADDEKPVEQPSVEAPPPPESTPEPSPEPEAPTLESLQAELETERHARKLYEETLASLQSSRVPSTAASSAGPTAPAGDPVVPNVGLSRAAIERIKAKTGMASDDEVGAALRWVTPLFEELAGPVVGYLGALADVADRHEARLSVEGYKELEEDVEKAVAAARARGSHLPRTELAQLERAKRLPKLLAQEAAAKKATKAEQRAAREATAIETTTQKVGPTAGGRATARSVDEVKSLPTREERIKALEEMAGNRTF